MVIQEDIALGFSNTKFFHTYAKIIRKKILIKYLFINDNMVTDHSMLENHLGDHFTKLFNQNSVFQENDLIMKVIPKLVNDSINDNMTMLPSEEEIYRAVH